MRPSDTVDEALRASRPARDSIDRTILVVDDDDQILELMGSFLRQLGYEVMLARDGASAIKLCEKRRAPIHLLITDVVMPVMRGPEMVQHLAFGHAEMRVLYMSAYPPDLIRHRDPRTPFIQKPFTLEALEAKVRDALRA